MSKISNRLGEDLGEVYLENYSRAFFLGANKRADEIEDALSTRFSSFFKDMASLVGGNQTPSRLALQGAKWKHLTPEWKYWKWEKNRLEDVNDNRFYHGLTGKFKGSIQTMDPIEAYGAPEVTVGSLKKYRRVQKGGKTVSERIDPSKVTTGGRLRYKGQFASLEKLFNVQLGFQAFPEINEMTDLLDAFSTRTANILAANDFGGAEKNPRPFLLPLYDYYLQVALPLAFERNAR